MRPCFGNLMTTIGLRLLEFGFDLTLKFRGKDVFPIDLDSGD